MLKELLKLGLPLILVTVVINGLLLAGAIWLVVWMLRALNVIN